MLLRPKINIKAPPPPPSLPPRTDILQIATLNINGLLSTTPHAMLENFIQLYDLDLVLLQEVTDQFTTPFSGYDIHYNIGTSRWGTAFLLRNTLMTTNLSRLP
jgi:exonuclease III